MKDFTFYWHKILVLLSFWSGPYLKQHLMGFVSSTNLISTEKNRTDNITKSWWLKVSSHSQTEIGHHFLIMETSLGSNLNWKQKIRYNKVKYPWVLLLSLTMMGWWNTTSASYVPSSILKKHLPQLQNNSCMHVSVWRYVKEQGKENMWEYSLVRKS